MGMEEELRQLFERTAQKCSGLLGVGFKDLTTGEEVYYNSETVFPTASVYKIFLLCELFRQQKAGLIRLSDRHTLREEEKSIGSGILEMIGEGAVFSLMDYVMLMMSVSDNTATDYLMKLAGPENIRCNILQPLGLDHSRCTMTCAESLTAYYGVTVEKYREMMAADERFHCRNGSYFACREENNQTSAGDMVKLLSLLYNGKFLDQDSDRQILDIMAQCQTNGRIPAGLPHGIRVAHKTGSIDHLANDCGIVYTGQGDYVLTLFYNGNLASEEEYEGTEWSAFGDALLSQLSGDVYDIFCKRR